VADAYDAMPHAPLDPHVHAAYAQLSREVEDQFQFLTQRAGVKTEPWTKPGQPYATSAEMRKDVLQRNHLWYFPSESGFGGTAEESTRGNPLLATGRFGLPINDELRVVHDYFGHTAELNEFGPKGEENAARAHGIMFSPPAMDALASETRGQNSFVNQGKHLRRPDGSLPRVGDTDYIKPENRPYAEQKTGLLPGQMRAVAPYGNTEWEWLNDRLSRPDGGFTVHAVTKVEPKGPGHFGVSVVPSRDRIFKSIQDMKNHGLARLSPCESGQAAWARSQFRGME